jgi:ribosomal protein S17E
MTLDFQTNKRVCEEVAIIPSKSLKNKVAGYATVRCSAAFPSAARACGGGGTHLAGRGPVGY